MSSAAHLLTPNAVEEMVNGKSSSLPENGTSTLKRVVKLTNIKPHPSSAVAVGTVSGNDSGSGIDNETGIDFERIRHCTIHDGIYSEDGFVYFEPEKEDNILVYNMLNRNPNFSSSVSLTISVKAYVTSSMIHYHKKQASPSAAAPSSSSSNDQNAESHIKPFIVITSFTTLDIVMDNNSDLIQVQPPRIHPSTKYNDGGKIATFLENKLQFMTDDDCAGLNANPLFGPLLDYDSIEKISDFISHYKSTSTSSSSSSTRLNNNHNENEKSHNYMKTVSNFASIQQKLQIASLRSNTGRSDEIKSKRIIEQHSKALQEAIKHATSTTTTTQTNECTLTKIRLPLLTRDVLCQWHRILGDDGALIEDAGVIRKKQVRAGSTLFTHKDSVHTELDKFCTLLHSLEHRLLLSPSAGLGDSSSSTSSPLPLLHPLHQHPTYNNTVNKKLEGLNPITFAAITLYGILDIHPFNDGNGRLARIAANWALHRAGFPFVVNLCATPTQRKEYVTAIQMTLQNLNLKYCSDDNEKNDVSTQHAHKRKCTRTRTPTQEDIYHSILVGVGLFKPLTMLIMERVHRASTECQKLIDEKSQQQSEEEEAKAAKRFREKAAKGTCLICLDDHPNIATLCCGKAVHINCIAEWLSSKNTCPACRSELPQLSRKVSSNSSRNNNDNIDFGNLIDIQIQMEERSEDDTREYDDTESVADQQQAEALDDTSIIIEGDEDSVDHTSDVDDNTTSIIVIEDPDSGTMSESDNVATNSDMDANNNNNNDDTGSMDSTTSVMEESCNDSTTFSAQESQDGSTTECVSSNGSTTDDIPSAPPAILFCSHYNCSNRAANDCSNVLCGRCCVLYGGNSCMRHGT